MGERIDELDPGTAAEDHKIPAMRDGHTVFVTVAQILDLAKGKLAAWFHGATSKATPIDADEIPIYNSVGGALGRLTFSNLWSWMQAKFHAATAKTAIVDADEFLIGDSAASFASKRSTFANLWAWLSSDPFAFQPIGIPFYASVGIAGTVAPVNTGRSRYIKLTAGLTGSGQFNNGLLTSESTSGSAPLILSTAVVSLVGSPINGQTIRHYNTEGRILRPGTSPGTLQDDAFQGHRHQLSTLAPGVLGSNGTPASGNAAGNATVTSLDPVQDGTNGAPRTANETRMRNQAGEMYMRIL